MFGAFQLIHFNHMKIPAYHKEMNIFTNGTLHVDPLEMAHFLYQAGKWIVSLLRCQNVCSVCMERSQG